VKSREEESPELITITGAQWQSASSLFDQGEGDKYSIYIVENAGKTNATVKKIQNPVKKWREGKLYAHPINLKL